MKNSFDFLYVSLHAPKPAFSFSSQKRQVSPPTSGKSQVPKRASHQLSFSSSSSSSNKSNSSFQTPNYRRLTDARISGLATANSHVIMESGYWFYWISPLFTLKIHSAGIEEGKFSKK